MMRPKFEDEPVDMNSNFRRFYLKERWFYMNVIDQEDPGEQGYKFKITVFNVSKDTKEAQDQEKDLFMQLSDFQAENIRINTKDPEKFRAYCLVRDKEAAKKFYTEFTRGIE